jgi:hypothetical protein
MELLNFLRNGGKPEELTAKYAIKVTSHKKFPNLLLFKYNQIDSPMGERIVQECRGIILDSTDNWKVVSFAYEKFFNHGEGHAAPIDMSTAKVMEKLDGSIMTVFYYANDWHVASSGMPDAAGQVNTLLGDTSFAQLFWATWKDLKYSMPVDKTRCYAFEMMTPYNKIICIYKKSNIVLHGVRDLNTLQELEPEPIAVKHGWECVKSYKMNSLTAVAEMAASLNPIDYEGYVVVDQNFNRVKVKNLSYVSLSHIKEGMSLRRMIEIVRTNESEEFLTYFPEFEKLYREVRKAFNELVQEIEATYEQHKNIVVQKDFALAINKKPYTGVLFALRKGDVTSAKQALRGMNIDRLGELLGL